MSGWRKRQIMENQMDSFKIIAADVEKLHDAKIELSRLIEDMDDILAPRMLQQFKKVITKIRMGLADVNRQKELQWETRYNYFNDMKEKEGMRTTWSIFEANDLRNQRSGITATELKYNGWGEATIKMAPGDKTWLEMWHYAEQVLYEADDLEHGFIESFTQAGDICILGTGS